MIELECIPILVGHGDEGICLWLRIGPYRILCDAGFSSLAQLKRVFSKNSARFRARNEARSGRNLTTLPIDSVWCSHAHEDHARGLWDLYCTYPDLPIYTSTITAHLLPLNWVDRPDPAQQTFCTTLSMHSGVEILPGLTLTLYPAGHLPGAAIALFSYQHPTENRTYTVLYSGDFLLSNTRLVDGLPLSELRELRPDVLIVEGSFGTVRHPHRRQQENHLTQRIYQAIQQNRSVLMVVPVLGLAQELLALLRSHHTFTGKNVDIWVDEAIAVGCDLYLDMLSALPEAIQNFAQHQPLFWDERIRPRVRRLTAQQRSQLEAKSCIVLLPSHTHLDGFLQDSSTSWLILLPQFPQYLQKYPKRLSQSALSKRKSVTLETYLLAEHCDGIGTTQLIHNMRPQHVVFIHGHPHNLDNLTSLEELASRYHLHLPNSETHLEFPIGLIQSGLEIQPDTIYQGELQEEGQQIFISLPAQIREDHRWRIFSDTGVVAASWQGENLILKGLQQYDLLMETTQGKLAKNIQGCLNCVSYRDQKCWNPASPLYELKVAPDGYCPYYNPRNEMPNINPNP